MRTILLLFLSAASLRGAIAYDNTAGAVSAAPAASLTYSHTAGSLSNRILVIGVSYYGVTHSVSTLTYAGASCTKIRRDNNGANQAASELWYILNPATGANNVVITMDASTEEIYGASVSLGGVAQSAPEANTGGVVLGSHTSHSNNITTVAAGAWIVDMLAYGQAGACCTAGGSQVSRRIQSGTLRSSTTSTLGPITPPAATAAGWTFGDPAVATAHSVASFAPAAGSARVAHKVTQ